MYFIIYTQPEMQQQTNDSKTVHRRKSYFGICWTSIA